MRSDRKRSRDRSRSPRRRRSPDRYGGRSRHHSESSGVLSAASNPFFDPTFFAHMQQAMLAATSQNAPYMNPAMSLANLQQMGATMAQLAQLGQIATPAPPQQQESFSKRDWIALYLRHGNGSVNPRADNMVIFEGPQAEQIIPRAAKLFTISAQSNVKNIAGSIAHTCRRCAAPVLVAVGEAPINQAVKGASIARDFLAQDDNPIMDLCVQPEFRSEGGMYLILFKTKIGAEMSRTVPALPDAEFVSMRSEEDEEKRGARIAAQEGIVKSGDTVIDATDFLRVAHGSDPHIVAGAIAKKIRRSDTVDLLAIGGAAVSVAVKAIAYARMYLVENCVSLHYVSSFVHLKLDTEERSGIRFMLCPKMVSPKFPCERITKAIGESSEEKTTGETKNPKFTKRDKSPEPQSDGADAVEDTEQDQVVKAEDSAPENTDDDEDDTPVLKPEKKRRAASPKASPKRKEKVSEKAPRATIGKKKDKEEHKRRTRDRSASVSSETEGSD